MDLEIFLRDPVRFAKRWDFSVTSDFVPQNGLRFAVVALFPVHFSGE